MNAFTTLAGFVLAVLFFALVCLIPAGICMAAWYVLVPYFAPTAPESIQHPPFVVFVAASFFISVVIKLLKGGSNGK